MNDRITIVIFMAFLSLVIAIALPFSVGIRIVTVLLAVLIGVVLIKLDAMLQTEESRNN